MIIIIRLYRWGGLVSKENQVFILLIAAVEAALGLIILIRIRGKERSIDNSRQCEGY